MIDNAIATEDQVSQIEKDAKLRVKEAKNNAWKAFQAELIEERDLLLSVLQPENNYSIPELLAELKGNKEPLRSDISKIAKKALRNLRGQQSIIASPLKDFILNQKIETDDVHCKTEHYIHQPIKETHTSRIRIFTEHFLVLLANKRRRKFSVSPTSTVNRPASASAPHRPSLSRSSSAMPNSCSGSQ